MISMLQSFEAAGDVPDLDSDEVFAYREMMCNFVCTFLRHVITHPEARNRVFSPDPIGARFRLALVICVLKAILANPRTDERYRRMIAQILELVKQVREIYESNRHDGASY